MDPLSLIIGALGAGVLHGTTAGASAVTQDAFAKLRDLLRTRAGHDADAVEALEGYETAPEIYKPRVLKVLRNLDAGSDPELVEAARRLLAAVDSVGFTDGKYVAELNLGQGVQIGDGNTQHNTFTR